MGLGSFCSATLVAAAQSCWWMYMSVASLGLSAWMEARGRGRLKG